MIRSLVNNGFEKICKITLMENFGDIIYKRLPEGIGETYADPQSVWVVSES
jgi:hypothetical protein